MTRLGLFIVCLFQTLLLSLDMKSGGVLSKNQKAMDVTHYDLDIKLDPHSKSIQGSVAILFQLYDKTPSIEIDLLESFHISGAIINGMSLGFSHVKNKIYIENPGLDLFKFHTLEVKYGGRPPAAKNPPWDGGFTWEKSEDGLPWVGVSCQSNGAHIWYPCKEHPSDKADSADIKITIPHPLKAVSNGLLVSITKMDNKMVKWHWKTKYPISTYNINFTIGNFNIIEKEGLVLNERVKLVYYVLPEDKKEHAISLLDEAEDYLNFYASYFGKYPWAKEKFGLVHAPYWGMEHQTINAYGNEYKKTKLGYDFILFHEMGHEWWGNYLSVSDWSDFWIHEGFDTYAEALYIEDNFGKNALKSFLKNRYKKNIKNQHPVVPQKNGTTKLLSGNDVYYKGAYVLHTLRYLIGDKVFKSSIKEFLHMPKELPNNQTSTDEFISLIEENTGLDLGWFFKIYLYNASLPGLNIKKVLSGNKQFVDLWWENEGFKMPIEVAYKSFDGQRQRKISLSDVPFRIGIAADSDLIIDPNGHILFNKIIK